MKNYNIKSISYTKKNGIVLTMERDYYECRIRNEKSDTRQEPAIQFKGSDIPIENFHYLHHRELTDEFNVILSNINNSEELNKTEFDVSMSGGRVITYTKLYGSKIGISYTSANKSWKVKISSENFITTETIKTVETVMRLFSVLS